MSGADPEALQTAQRYGRGDEVVLAGNHGLDGANGRRPGECLLLLSSRRRSPVGTFYSSRDAVGSPGRLLRDTPGGANAFISV
jgi:hypothetical protein